MAYTTTIGVGQSVFLHDGKVKVTLMHTQGKTARLQWEAPPEITIKTEVQLLKEARNNESTTKEGS